MARILIVDDSEMDRVLERSILEKAGHTILLASDGESALACCRRSPLDMVITDLAMPEVGGLSLIKELRAGGCDLPIIAVSGLAADRLGLAHDYGADFTLVKPVDGDELLLTVGLALKSYRPPSRNDAKP